jgi:DNA-binding MarR family transcriptional regulator
MRVLDDKRTEARPPTAAEVARAAAVLERSLSWLRRAVRPAEWSAVALSALDAVDRRGPLRVTALVAQERITQPGMTSVIGRLADAGYVERHPDPADGRATLVTITPEGRAYIRGLHKQRADALAAHVRELSPDDQRALVAARAALEALAARPITTEES